MALINCPDCDKQVSTNAPACPNCGAPIASVAVERTSGGRIPYSDQEIAVLVSQKGKVSHLLHFFLSLFTLGLWIPVWILLGIMNSITNDLIDTKIVRGMKRGN
jgi:hypothetical protein